MSARHAIYLDSNAGAPLCQEARHVLRLLSESEESFFANPSSVHFHGQRAKRLISEARENVAASLGRKTNPDNLLFTSSGTEANQTAIRSVISSELLRGKKPHWITTPVEHDSVLKRVDWVKKQGGTVDFLPVDSDGRADAGVLESLLKPDTSLVSLIWINNETGVISDIQKFSKITRKKGIFLHLDGAQAWGKIPVHAAETGADFISFSGHKIGALSGTGLLWSRSGVPIAPLILGHQERGRRGGTENALGMVTLGAAAASIQVEDYQKRWTPLRDKLEQAICERIKNVTVNGKGAPRAANTLNLSFGDVETDSLVMALDLEGFSVSAGSACSSGVIGPSPVLMALGRSQLEALASIRISLGGSDVKWLDLEQFVDALSTTVERLRQFRNG